jgi:hypothetical protein
MRAVLVVALLACAGSGWACSSSPAANAPDDAGSKVPDARASSDGTASDAAGSDASTLDASAADANDAGSFRIAWSVSPFTGTLFNVHAVFSDGTRLASTPTELEQLYLAHGANEMYVRIATELQPISGSGYDESYTAALSTAALARSLGLPLNPELGLWADYGALNCQPPPDFSGYPSITVPGAWDTLTVDQMVPVLQAYGTLMAHALLDPGTKVDFWDVGNEIDLGTAGVAPQGFDCATPWQAPDGVDSAIGQQTVTALLAMPEPERVAWLTAHVWPSEARLLSAVEAGVRAVDPSARFETHISEADDTAFGEAFYGAMIAAGVQLDELGFSFYPSSSTAAMRASDFMATIEGVHAQFGKPVFVAEFAYPNGPIGTGAYTSWTNALPSYPVTAQGQASVLHDMASWGVTAGMSGIRYWAPEVFIAGWGGMAVFAAPDGGPSEAQPALDALSAGVASPNPTAFHD